MNNLLDNLMTNHEIDSDDNIYYELHGGSENKPNGGFPPIFICDKNIKNITAEPKSRSLNPQKNVINIKNILDRRSIVPFIALQREKKK